jgi:hypothetical protein
MTTDAFAKPNRRHISSLAYWIITTLVALNFLFGGITTLLGVRTSTEVFVRLGYPGYFGAYLAVWQLLAVVALLVPGPQVLREWAYAGLVLDTLSATYSLGVTGSPVVEMLPALVVFGLTIISYCGWRQRLRVVGA